MSKIDAIQYGPFKVVGCCKKRPANYDLFYLAIPGSNKSAHTEHLRIWPGIKEKVDSGEYRGPPFVAGPKGIGFSQINLKGAKIPRRGDYQTSLRKARGSVLGGITCVQEMEVCNCGCP